MSRDLQRLDCYDRLSGKVSSFAEEAVPTSAVNAAKATTVATATTAKESNFGLKEVEKAPVSGSNPDFGLKKVEQESDSDDSMHTSIVGKFSGWRRNDVFTMANGQVWKVVDKTARLYYRAENPKVTITRTGFGTFRISLDGENKTTLVARIK